MKDEKAALQVSDGTTYDVIVLGCGPSGMALAWLLAQQGVRVAAVDKHRLVVPYPRATHLDDETVRLFQALGGLAHAMEPGFTVSGDFTVYDADWRPCIEVKSPPTAQQSGGRTDQGWHLDYMFQQPDFESRLRGMLVACPQVDTFFGWEASSIEEDPASGVRVRVGTSGSTGRGTERVLRAAWLVGCDGANSTVRRHMGADHEDLNGTQRSLILDVFPFVDDHLLRGRSSFIHVQPGQNPLTFVRTQVPRLRLELMLRATDRTEDFEDHRQHYATIHRFLPPGAFRIERADVYEWRSLLVRGWRRGRCLLAGDAAHQMAPMMGQGMCSGIRDSANLAWKLARVVHGVSPEALLDTYETERAPHARRYIELSADIANQVEGWADTAPPPQASTGGAGQRISKSKPRLGPGLHNAAAPEPAGRLSPQPRLPDGRLLDDAVGYAFAAIGTFETLNGVNEATRTTWDRLGLQRVPDPGEDGLRWLRDHDAAAAIIRPDRYVVGLARDAMSVDRLTSDLARIVCPPLRL